MTPPTPASHARVPVAVVGVGNMGRHHARNYADLARSELRAIVDVDGDAARAVAGRYGGRVFADVDELLRHEPDVAAASVAVPTSGHFEVAAQLVEAGKHVLVEKPIAATLEEAGRLVDLARRHSVVLAVGHVERFNPAVAELKRQIRTGRLGRVISILARRVGVMPPQMRDANVIIDLAIHDLDVVRHLLEADQPSAVHCNAGTALLSDRFDFADILVRFGEVSCLFQANWLTPVKIRSLAVNGSEGYAELDYVTQRLDYHPAQHVTELQSFRELERVSVHRPTRLRVAHGEPLARELDAFLAAVLGEDADIVTGEEGTRSMAAAEKVLEALSADAARQAWSPAATA